MNKTLTAPDRSGELLRAGQVLTVTGRAMVEWLENGLKKGPILVNSSRQFGPFAIDQQLVISAISGSVVITDDKVNFDRSVSINSLSARKKIALVGDSFVVRDYLSVGTNPPTIGTTVSGIFSAAITELKQSLEIVYLSGVNGSLITDADTGESSGFLSRLPDALATDADYVYIPFSVNSFKNATVSMSFDALVESYSKAFFMIREAGKIPVTTTYFPSYFNDTALEQLTAVRFTDWLLDQQSNSDLIVCDVRYSCADKSSLTLQADQYCVEKVGGVIGNTNVHRNPAGVILDAKAIAASLKKYIPTFDVPWIHSYNASASNSRISAIQNPIMVGTTGSKDNGTTGSVAANWGVSPSVGDACAASKVTRTDAPGEWQQIVWTPAAASKKLEFYSAPRFDLGDKSGGDAIEYLLEFEIDDLNVGMLKSMFCQATFYNSSVVNVGSSIYNTDYSNSAVNTLFPWIKAPSGIVATPKFTIPADATSVLFKFGLYSYAGGSPVTVRVGRLTYL